MHILKLYSKKGDAMKLSLVIPCYNEEGNVEQLYLQCVNVFSKKSFDYELIFVDDGSSDNTLNVLENLYSQNPESNIQVLSFSRNFGKEAAIFAGLNNASGDYTCIIDADLQQSPKTVLEMLERIELNPDIDCVAAYQEKRNEGRLMCFFKSAFYKIINKISDVEYVNGASDFRLMNRKMVEAIKEIGEYHRFSKGIFGFIGFNTEYMPYTVDERLSGKTKWGFKKLMSYAIDGMLSYSTLPLRIATYSGLISALLSVFYIIAVIIEKLAFGIPTPGYATIVVLILFLGGMQLFCLGLLGEYMAKVYIQVKNRPIYILKKHLTKDKADNEK